MTQSIIVYSPVEYALYQGGLMIPLLGACVVGGLVFVILARLFDRKLNSFGNSGSSDWLMGGFALVAFIAAALVFHKLAI